MRNFSVACTILWLGGVLAIVLLPACTEKSSKDIATQSQETLAVAPPESDFSFSLVPGQTPDVLLELVASADSKQPAIRQIVVTHRKKPGELQVIATTDSELLNKSGELLEVLDMNFDGYNDFRYPLYRTASPNTPYKHWVYDPLSRQFIGNLELDELSSITWDPIHKHINSSWRDGQSYGTDTYRYEENNLVKIKQSITRYRRDGGCQRTIEDVTTGQKETSNCQE